MGWVQEITPTVGAETFWVLPFAFYLQKHYGDMELQGTRNFPKTKDLMNLR